MKNFLRVIKLKGINGKPVYIRDTFNVSAIASETNGELDFTTVHLLGVMFRVKESVEEVAELLGWTDKESNKE